MEVGRLINTWLYSAITVDARKLQNRLLLHSISRRRAVMTKEEVCNSPLFLLFFSSIAPSCSPVISLVQPCYCDTTCCQQNLSNGVSTRSNYYGSYYGCPNDSIGSTNAFTQAMLRRYVPRFRCYGCLWFDIKKTWTSPVIMELLFHWPSVLLAWTSAWRDTTLA